MFRNFRCPENVHYTVGFAKPKFISINLARTDYSNKQTRTTTRADIIHKINACLHVQHVKCISIIIIKARKLRALNFRGVVQWRHGGHVPPPEILEI